MAATPPALLRVELGRRPYQEVWALQRRLVDARRQGALGDDLLLLCEHDPVVTVGRKVERDDPGLPGALAAGLPVVEVERGGGPTYHGPGQLVGYPVVLLGPEERDLHRFLRALEEALIAGLALAGLAGERRDGLTGVWVGGRKLASIGIACRGWVTYHGFALNLDLDLGPFHTFRPCGLEAAVMSSVAALGGKLDRDALAARVHEALAAQLGRSPGRCAAGSLEP